MRVTPEATSEDTRPAKNNELVNSCRMGESNLQYGERASEVSAARCCAATEGKKEERKAGMEVTPPVTPMS